MIEAADAERRRVGRDLHDGAQQRLLAVSNLLRVARMKSDGAATSCSPRRGRARPGARELRELARGLHPVALSERGLRAALESLCASSAVPVELDITDDALPDAIAAAAYFVVAETLANTSRYAQASRVAVRSSHAPGSCTSRSPTTASAAPTSPRAPACPASPTASRCSRAASTSRARPAPATALTLRSRCEA